MAGQVAESRLAGILCCPLLPESLPCAVN